MTPKIRLEVITSRLFAENAYVAFLENRNDCLVIDPGFDAAEIMRTIARHRLIPAAILNTHGHSDHIAGNDALKRNWPDCPLVIGAGDAPKLTDANLNLSASFGVAVTSPAADVLVRDGEHYEAAGIELEVREIPGHSVGHVIFIYKAYEPWIVFGGDVLFQGSIGRTDFPDGSMQELLSGIAQKVLTLPDDTIVLPGHGPATTVGAERQHNPFLESLA